MRKAARPHAIREVSGPETRVSLGVASNPGPLIGLDSRLHLEWPYADLVFFNSCMSMNTVEQHFFWPLYTGGLY